MVAYAPDGGYQKCRQMTIGCHQMWILAVSNLVPNRPAEAQDTNTDTAIGVVAIQVAAVVAAVVVAVGAAAAVPIMVVEVAVAVMGVAVGVVVVEATVPQSNLRRLRIRYTW